MKKAWRGDLPELMRNIIIAFQLGERIAIARPDRQQTKFTDPILWSAKIAQILLNVVNLLHSILVCQKSKCKDSRQSGSTKNFFRHKKFLAQQLFQERINSLR